MYIDVSVLKGLKSSCFIKNLRVRSYITETSLYGYMRRAF